MITRSLTLATAALLLFATFARAAAPAPAIKVKITETSFGKLLPGKNAARILFSADGLHAVYAVQQISDWKVVLDGKVLKSHDWVAVNTLTISEAGGHVAYTVQEKDGSMRVVVDGVEQKPYTEVSPPVLSPDGKRHMYWAKAAKDAKGQIVVVDGVASTGEFEKVVAKSLQFSRDGKRFAFTAQRDGKNFHVIDWAEGKAYEQVGALEFSKNGSRYGFKAERGHRNLAVIDGREQKEYEKVGGFAFSDDGKHVAYAAADELREGGEGAAKTKKFLIVLDGKELPDPDAQLVSEPVFSPDGSRLAYVSARKRAFTVVVDGKPIDEPHDVAGDIQFSADARHVVYRARDEKLWRVIVDGKPGKPYDATGNAQVSPDGSKVAYAAKDGVNTWLVINETELPGDLNISLSPTGKYVAHAMEPKEIGRVNTNALLINGQEVHSVKGFLKGSRFVWDGDKKFYAMTGRELEIIRLEVAVED